MSSIDKIVESLRNDLDSWEATWSRGSFRGDWLFEIKHPKTGISLYFDHWEFSEVELWVNREDRNPNNRYQINMNAEEQDKIRQAFGEVEKLGHHALKEMEDKNKKRLNELVKNL